MGQIDYTVSDHVATIVLNNPKARNAVDSQMSAQLVEAYDDVVSNDDVRAVIITGEGDRAFCAGASIKGYLSGGVLGEDAENQRKPIPKPWRIYKPIIAAIEGYCVGGGFTLALYCDLRVVTTAATLGASGHKRGVANGATQGTMGTRIVRRADAMELLFLSKYVDGTEAYRVGLAQRLVEPGGALAEAMEMARTIASFSPDAVQGTKRLCYDNHDLTWDQALDWELEVSERSFRTADALEGFTAFAEKREPVFGQEPALHTLGFEEFWPNADPPQWRTKPAADS
jgi:enoyl-CoA hydratase/carnithine racemase